MQKPVEVLAKVAPVSKLARQPFPYSALTSLTAAPLVHKREEILRKTARNIGWQNTEILVHKREEILRKTARNIGCWQNTETEIGQNTLVHKSRERIPSPDLLTAGVICGQRLNDKYFNTFDISLCFSQFVSFKLQLMFSSLFFCLHILYLGNGRLMQRL